MVFFNFITELIFETSVIHKLMKLFIYFLVARVKIHVCCVVLTHNRARSKICPAKLFNMQLNTKILYFKTINCHKRYILKTAIELK